MPNEIARSPAIGFIRFTLEERAEKETKWQIWLSRM
jgi:hypothetical protein